MRHQAGLRLNPLLNWDTTFNCDSKAILLQASFLIGMARAVLRRLLNSISSFGLKTSAERYLVPGKGYLPQKWNLSKDGRICLYRCNFLMQACTATYLGQGEKPPSPCSSLF